MGDTSYNRNRTYVPPAGKWTSGNSSLGYLFYAFLSCTLLYQFILMSMDWDYTGLCMDWGSTLTFSFCLFHFVF